jgi:hypothetical protein
MHMAAPRHQPRQRFALADTPSAVRRVAEDIDVTGRPVRGTRWQASHPGDREVRV